jgi:predicted dehydrogenase
MLRIGLAGTGAWARAVHLPALLAHPSVEFAGLWGRNGTKAASVAADAGVQVFEDFDEMVAAVDVVDLVLVPSVQLHYALRAARAGRHLLLEKPISFDSAAASALAEVVADHGLAAAVFLSRLYDRERRLWLRQRAGEGWSTGHLDWRSSGLLPSDAPGVAWRQDAGPLFDVGPHVFSQLEYVLGSIESVVSIDADDRGVVSLQFRHESGATSTAAIDLYARVDFTHEKLRFESAAASVALAPQRPVDFRAAFSAMVDDLVAQVLAKPAQDADVRHLAGLEEGIRMVRLIEHAHSFRSVDLT